jgi:small subunit ribosomal protein S6
MIYELALVARPESTDDQVNALKDLVKDVLKTSKGEVLMEDDWGTLTYAQPDKNGGVRGRYTYLIFKTDSIESNVELARRFRISEDVVRHLIVKLADDNSEQDAVLKNFKCPYSKTNNGSVTDEPESEDSDDKERKRFSRRKNCWFSARKFKADWKDPKTFAWLVNEFGKITPARVSGISVKHQRFVTTAVKRARNIGIASYLSNYTAE